MKITKYLSIAISLGLAAFFTGCGSVPKTQEHSPAPAEETAPVQETVSKAEKDEYTKSVGDLTVSKDTYEADRAEILSIIEKLNVIMKDIDYQSWLLYVDNESKTYWSQPANLKKAQSKLPVKGLQLRNLQDYFKYVFIGARVGRSVSTLRYVSDTYVKAVQIIQPETEEREESYTVYYYFNKKDGHWELHLPEIED
jgi:hypothetical protein